jgi:hypothetical protein
VPTLLVLKLSKSVACFLLFNVILFSSRSLILLFASDLTLVNALEESRSNWNFTSTWASLRFCAGKMPKGHKIIDWTPENEVKLFHAILAIHGVKIDYAAVAKEFGEFYPHLYYLFLLQRFLAFCVSRPTQPRRKSTQETRSRADV